MKRKTISSEKRAMDRLFSEFIRKRAIVRVHGCERCGAGKVSYKELQCSHYWGRIKKSTRWDEDDAAGLCGGCHMHLEQHPLIHTQWFKEYLGQEAFEYLAARALKPAKPDLNLIAIYLQEKIALLEKG